MREYRVIEYDNCGKRTFEIQKKSILGFWYTPINIDNLIIRQYNPCEEVKKYEEAVKNGRFNKD